MMAAACREFFLPAIIIIFYKEIAAMEKIILGQNTHINIGKKEKKELQCCYIFRAHNVCHGLKMIITGILIDQRF